MLKKSFNLGLHVFAVSILAFGDIAMIAAAFDLLFIIANHANNKGDNQPALTHNLISAIVILLLRS